jgi:hypothetical protein
MEKLTRSRFKIFQEFIGTISGCFYSQGILHYEFIPEGKTVNKEMYIDTPRHFMDTVSRKRHER